MRTLMIPLILATLPAMAVKPTNSLFVVVHTVDRVVVDYVCQEEFAETSPDAIVFKTQVMSQGAFTWHAVGGKAPYTLVRDLGGGDGGECVTVVDANGDTAMGCGSINEVRTRRYVSCSGILMDTTSYPRKGYPKYPKQKPQIMPISSGSPVPAPTPGPPTVDPKNPGWNPPPPTPAPGPDPKDPGHLSPVSDPDPGVHPPLPPAPPIHTPSRPPVRRSAPAPGPSSHGTTTIQRVSSPTGGGSMSHGTSHTSGGGSSGSGSSGTLIRTSPAPH